MPFAKERGWSRCDFNRGPATEKIHPTRQARIYESMATTTEFSLNEAIALLTRTPATLHALLRGLPDIWVRRNEGHSNQGKDTWSAFDIVGHLIVGERTHWMTRAPVILNHGEEPPF